MTDQASAEAPRTGGWREIWAGRRLDPQRGSVLAQLLAADGFDTGFGDVIEENWVAYVRGWAAELGLGPGTSVFEVGCGSGAFLYELRRLGCSVAGLDQSESLVAVARSVLPDAAFSVADAAGVPTEPQADVVISVGVFCYFPSLDYAEKVIERMAAKAGRAVLLVDLPDLARRGAALAHRVATVGGPDAYAARYEDLDHLYFARDWVADKLRSVGFDEVHTADQDLADYSNAAFRFNAWGRRAGAVG